MTPETQKFIDLLESQLGYAERAGAYTKFGHWYGKNVEFDADYTAAPWCDMFLAWAANKLGYEEWMGEFAWTVSHAKWFKKNDAWGTKPEVGAFVFFDWSGSDDIDRIDHVGVVTKVVGRKIHTIEGNIDGGIAKRKIRDTDKVVGYGYPERIKERLDEQLAKQQAIENAHREQLSQPPGQQVNQLQNGPLSSLIPSTEVYVEVQPPLAARREQAPKTGNQAQREGAPSPAEPGAQPRTGTRTEAQAKPQADTPRADAAGRTEKKGKHAKPATADTTAVTAEPLPPTVEAARPVTAPALDSPTLVGSALVAALALLAIAKTRQLRARPALAAAATAAASTPAARRHRHRRKAGARTLFAAAAAAPTASTTAPAALGPGTPPDRTLTTSPAPSRAAGLPTPEAPETVPVPARVPAELPIAARLAAGAGAESPLESFEPIVIPRTPAAGSPGPRFRPFEPVTLRLPTPSAGAQHRSGDDALGIRLATPSEPLSTRLSAPSEPLSARLSAPSGPVGERHSAAPAAGRRTLPFEPIAIPEATSSWDAFAPPAGRAAAAHRPAGGPPSRDSATGAAHGSWDAFERPARPSRRHEAGYTAQARTTRLEGSGGYRGRRRRSGHPIEEPAAFTADAPLRGRRHRVTAPHCPDQQRQDPHGSDPSRPAQRRLDAPWAEHRLDASWTAPQRGGDGGTAVQDATAFAAWDRPTRGRRHARGADGPVDGQFFQDTPSRGRRHRASRPAETPAPAGAAAPGAVATGPAAFTPATYTPAAFTPAGLPTEEWSPATTGAFAAVVLPAPADVHAGPDPGVTVPWPEPDRPTASAGTASASTAPAGERRSGSRRGRHRA
ncbi:CHAP domain-containing protein [Nonomuraea indica]|uniref:CHAP domain-containing protein n=1 Tax=Nonomuraea indica TaxID=1581193 RepID=UPI000C7A16E9|nr:CHAP domain-containing protein [Nonomuraea indica]